MDKSGAAAAVTDESGYPPARVRWGAVVVLLILAIVAYLDRQILSLLVAPIRADLQITDMQVSLLQGFAFAILYAVAGLPLGWAVDRVQRRLVIFAGLAVWSIATLMAGLAETYGHLLVTRIFVGMGEAALAPAAYSMISDMFPKKRLAFVLSIYMIGQQLGSSVALLVGGATVTWAANGLTLPLFGELNVWQATFVLCGGPGLLIGLLIFLIPEPKRRLVAGEVGSWAQFFSFMKARRKFFSLHFAGFSLAMTLAYAMGFWAPVILMRRYGWEVGEVGLYYGIADALIVITGLLINGRLVDRMVGRGVTDAHMRYYVWASLSILVSAALMAFAPNGWLFILAIAPCKMLFAFTGVSAAALQVVTPSSLRGRVSAVYLLVISMVGITLGPASVAFFTDYVLKDDGQVGLSMSLAFVTIAPIAGLLFWLGMKPMRRAVAMADELDPQGAGA